MPPVDVIRQKDSTTNAKNLLFLGDGFAAADKPLFDWTVEEVTDRLFRFIKPFDLPGVAEKFNIFAAFTPSPSSGISCSAPIIELPGPRMGRIHDSGTGHLLDKPSALALTYTGGTHIAVKPFADGIIDGVVGSLSHPFEALDETAIPACWIGGKDRGLVVVLVNDDVRGGTALTKRASGVDFCSATMGRQRPSSFRLIFDFSNPPALPPHVWDHSPLVATLPRKSIAFNQITDVVAHELAHSRFQLKDEYVNGFFDPAAGSGSYATPNNFPNVTTDHDAQDSSGKYTNVKWKDDMLPSVKVYVESTGPLRRDAQCGTYTTGQRVKKSDAQPPAPPQFAKLATPRSRLIGLYEGGAGQPCGVFRPAGICKMRSTSYIEDETEDYVSSGFCYVCKKAIIADIDPALIPTLRARDYPS